MLASTDPLAPVRHLDVLLIVLAAPFVVLMGLPVLGYLVGGGAWVLSRLAGSAIERQARTATDIRRSVGLSLAGSMARAWFVALAVLVVGLAAEREDGLTAALIVLFAFTLHLTTSLTLRAFERTPAR